MSEPIIEPTPIDHAAVAKELQTVVTELRGKNAQRKTRIAELEAAMTAKDNTISQLQTTVRQITIDGPLKEMSEQISNAPELWLEQFSKSHRLDMVDGKLTVLTADGKPSGVAFQREALAKHLTDEKLCPEAKNFKAITVVSRASGASNTGTQRRVTETEAPNRMHFGLR